MRLALKSSTGRWLPASFNTLPMSCSAIPGSARILAPRDRSLVTVTALIANGQAAQVAYHLNRAMDNGLTQTEAAEAATHSAFYVGWPNVFSALPVAKDVFEKQAR